QRRLSGRLLRLDRGDEPRLRRVRGPLGAGGGREGLASRQRAPERPGRRRRPPGPAAAPGWGEPAPREGDPRMIVVGQRGCALLAILPESVQLLCELKGEGTAEDAVRFVREAGKERQVVFTCFDLARIRRVKEIDSSLRTGAIFGAPPPDFARQAKDAGAEGV